MREYVNLEHATTEGSGFSSTDALALMAIPSFPDEFDPFQLRPDASLNRTLLGAVAGGDERLVGRGAFGLLSLGALKQLCVEHGFPDDGRILESVARELSSASGQSVGSEAPNVGREAPRIGGEAPSTGGEAPSTGSEAPSIGGEAPSIGGEAPSIGGEAPSIGGEAPSVGRPHAVCREYGRRLAHLIASLITPGASKAWNAWRSEYLGYWSGVDRIWLGGGVAAAFGPELAQAVRAALAQLGSRQCETEIAPNPAILAVLGSARSRGDPLPQAISLDFGHSMVKRGVAIVRKDFIERLELLPPLAVPSMESNPAQQWVLDFVLDTIADTYRAAQHRYSEIDPRVVVSLATYVSNGLPVDVRSLYQPLGGVTLKWLEDELRRRVGAAVQLTFLHDGTAAARALPEGGDRAAVIMLGTALGVGFRPLPNADLLPIAPDLVVQELTGDEMKLRPGSRR